MASAVIIGVRDADSIAWHLALAFKKAGYTIAVGYQERNEATARPLADAAGILSSAVDATDDDSLERFYSALPFPVIDVLVHSIAFAPKRCFTRKIFNIEKKDIMIAFDASVQSLLAMVRVAGTRLKGSVLTLTYEGSQKVVPGYSIMGPFKAALESAVAYLAADLSERGVRVNALSPGPVKTTAAAVIPGFSKMLALSKTTKDDIAKAALEVAQGHMTGQIIPVKASREAWR